MSKPSSSFTFKKNGEKGAEAHTVSEETRIKFTKMLIDMRESKDVDTIEMPVDLTNTERKFIHLLASQLDLKSKSSGKGDSRRITISRGSKETSSNNENPTLDPSTLPPLRLSSKGSYTLELYLQKFPPTSNELTESAETIIIDNFASDLIEEDVAFASDVDDVVLTESLDTLQIQASENLGLPPYDLTQRTQWYHDAQRLKLKHPRFREMQTARVQLPAYTQREEICAAVRNHRVIIISGDTGCGKSTQVPQFLLDDKFIGPTANIIVTQPRRISAISIAERIAAERCEEIGKTVGYSVRLDTASSRQTQLLFVTPGVLLRRFLSHPNLDEYTICIIDEIHERDKYTEFLLIILRDLMNRRPNLRIIMMSATIQTQELVQYWTGLAEQNTVNSMDYRLNVNHHHSSSHLCSKPAEIFIPGRTFPVQEFYLEDILSMTGYVDREELSLNRDMDRIEADMASLIKNITGNQSSRIKCVICGQTASCPEELGAHVAFCDGGGNNLFELEEKIRDMKSNEFLDRSRNMKDFSAAIVSSCYENSSIHTVADIHEEDIEDDPGLVMGKWDGESPFTVADALSRVKNTLTEEELLRRYQVSHDDDEIDFILIIEVLRLIHRSSYGNGAILVFLPGWQEISELSLQLESAQPFNNKANFILLALHSSIPSTEQRRVFIKPPRGVRKIILATNIAETSLTIDDVAFIIDTGRAKEKNYDPHLKTSTLQPAWISQASAKQRKGRAGRTKAGVAFRLYSRRRHDSFRPFLESELLRTPLEELCLLCKRLGLTPGGEMEDNGIPAFLASALSPPHPKSILNGLHLLVQIGAMEPETNDLTHLGKCLAALSLEPSVGKMVIWGYILGVAKATSSMAVAMSHKSPFIIPPPSMQRNSDQAKVELSEGSESDQVTVLNVLKAFDTLVQRGRFTSFANFCRSRFINEPTIKTIAEMRGLISRELLSLDFPDPNDMSGPHNRNGRQVDLASLQAAIIAGLYPNVASRTSGEASFNTLTKRKARIHVSSVNASSGQRLGMKSKVQQGDIELMAFGELVRGSSSFTMSQTSYISSPLPLLLLCGNLRVQSAGPSTKNEKVDVVLNLDDSFYFTASQKLASSLVTLRRRLNRVFSILVTSPATGLYHISEKEKAAIETLSALLKIECKGR